MKRVHQSLVRMALGVAEAREYVQSLSLIFMISAVLLMYLVRSC